MTLNKGINKLGSQMRQYNKSNNEIKKIKLICLSLGLDAEAINKVLVGNVAPKTKKRKYKNTL